MRGQELLLLAKVREKSGNIRGALATLKEAKENQHRYIQRLAVSPDVADQKHMLANICLTMADYASTLRNYDEAIIYYKEALAHKPTDVNALLSLAKLYMQVNNTYRICKKKLKIPIDSILTSDENINIGLSGKFVPMLKENLNANLNFNIHLLNYIG